MEISTWRAISALAAGPRTFFFEIGKKDEKTLKRIICRARGVMLPSCKTSNFNFFVWFKMMVLGLPVEETEMSWT